MTIFAGILSSTILFAVPLLLRRIQSLGARK